MRSDVALRSGHGCAPVQSSWAAAPPTIATIIRQITISWRCMQQTPRCPPTLGSSLRKSRGAIIKAIICGSTLLVLMHSRCTVGSFAMAAMAAK